jgi:molecular chaperone DnaJ
MQFEYYSLLEIERTATADEIKKAYRKKAMELHPDRHGGDKQKETEFKKLNEAYGVLSDEQKKAHYDRFGTMDNHGWGFGGGGFQNGFDVDLGDIFSSFFGWGFGGNGGRGNPRKQVGADIEMELKISLEDALRGTNRKISFKKNIICHHCAWKWWKTIRCDTCGWAGQVRERVQTVFGVMEQPRTCHVCHGTGEKITEKCDHCHGKWSLEEKVEKTIDIPAGIENGMSIKMRDEWNGWRDGNGDLYIAFIVPEKEWWLTRDWANLHYTHKISPAIAALWSEDSIDIPIIGKKIVNIKPGTQSGANLIFRNEWAPRLDRKWTKGDCIIHIEVVIPTKLSSDEQALYQALLQAESGKKMKKGWLDGFFSE